MTSFMSNYLSKEGGANEKQREQSLKKMNEFRNSLQFFPYKSMNEKPEFKQNFLNTH